MEDFEMEKANGPWFPRMWYSARVRKRSFVLELGLAFAVLVMLVYFATRSLGTGGGNVNVTATIESPLEPSIVAVNGTATSTFDAYYDPPSGVPEGDLTATYSWAVTLVQFKQLQSDSFGTAKSGSYTATFNPAKASASSSATLAFTPLIAGYWQVTVHCAVFVLDTKEGLSWNDYPGTGNAGPQDLTSAAVSFSPNPIETGADREPHQQGAIFAKVTATVVPKDLVSDISVNNFTTLPQGTGAAAVENSQPDYSTGQIVFDLYGTAGTAPSMPNGDVKIEAKDGSAVLGSAMVIIEIPKAIGTPHPTFGPQAVSPAHYVLTSGSSPAGFGVPLGKELLDTAALDWMTIPVIDQFGKALSSVYKGAPVDEEEGSSWDPINQTMSASGTYQDPVYVYTSGQTVPVGNPNNVPWPALTSPQGPYSASASVEVAGFQLNPAIVNRNVSYANGMLTITWP